MPDVLTRGDGTRDHDLPRRLGRVFGRHDRVDALGHRRSGHDAYGGVGPRSADERLTGHRLAEHREA